MAKRQHKTKRSSSKRRQVLSQQYTATPAQESQRDFAASPSSTPSAASDAHRGQGVVSESSRVFASDLRKIGIVSGVIFAVLAVLSAVLPHLLD